MRTPEFGKAEGRTADPSTTLGMTKGTAALPFRFDSADEERQVPSLRYAPAGMTLLFGNAKYRFQDELFRSGRDDNFLPAWIVISTGAARRDLRWLKPYPSS